MIFKGMPKYEKDAPEMNLLALRESNLRLQAENLKLKKQVERQKEEIRNLRDIGSAAVQDEVYN